MNRRLRVLLVTPDFPPSCGGIQLTAHRLVGHWPELLTRVVTCRPVRAAGRRSLVFLNMRAVLEAQLFNPDVVLSLHIVVSPAAWVIHRTTGTPYIQYLHGTEVAARPRLARFAVRHAAAVTAVSAHTASLIARSVRYGRLHRISPGVDLPQSRLSQRSVRPLVLTVSRLAERYKGHDVMIRALPLVRAHVPNVEWIVIGDGPLRSTYERMACALGVSDQVRFLGPVDDAERDLWLDRAHVFAMPSRLSGLGGGEGFGIVYLEAAAHRLPVVAGNVAGAVDAVVDGVTGSLVDPTDHVAVAEAIVDLLADPQRAEAYGRAGECRARASTWPKAARQLESVLREVASARAA